MASEGRYQEALELIKQDNPFPAVCGDICNRRCEDVCTRGTVDEPIAIDEIKKGKVTYRTDKEGNVAVIIGKKSFSTEKLVENYKTIYDVILKARPAAVKGTYMKNVVVSSSMSPSVKVDHLV